jgi:hypothetical protein
MIIALYSTSIILYAVCRKLHVLIYPRREGCLRDTISLKPHSCLIWMALCLSLSSTHAYYLGRGTDGTRYSTVFSYGTDAAMGLYEYAAGKNVKNQWTMVRIFPPEQFIFVPDLRAVPSP